MAPTAAFGHLLTEHTAAIGNTKDIDPELFFPVLLLQIKETPADHDARVVHQDIGHAVLGPHLFGEPFPCGRIGDIELEGHRPVAFTMDDLRCLLGRRQVDVGGHHLRPALGELDRDGSPDAAAGAGHHHKSWFGCGEQPHLTTSLLRLRFGADFTAGAIVSVP
ncbi:Uncharacterised protein [Mycobacteroides abscessus subsp. abscessus]|nr:Uncharacterised protein [Mycobacteroides abscessus subsp. abscessus]